MTVLWAGIMSRKTPFARVCAIDTSSSTPSAAAAEPSGPRRCPVGAFWGSAARQARSRARSPWTMCVWCAGRCRSSRQSNRRNIERECRRRTAPSEGRGSVSFRDLSRDKRSTEAPVDNSLYLNDLAEWRMGHHVRFPKWKEHSR